MEVIYIAKVKKINPVWTPAENRELKVGEVVEITDYLKLVKSGMGVLVDDDGNELPPPGEVFTCPICYRKTETLAQFTSHVGAVHSPVKPNVTIAEPKSALGEATQTREEQIRQQRIEILAKARATAKANRDAAAQQKPIQTTKA